MPSLLFLTVSQPMMGAALAVQGVPAPAPAVEAAAWSLQDAPPPAEQPAPEEPQDDSGEIVVEGEYGPPAGDPAEKFNAESYRITNAVDQAVIEPVAYAYRDGLPAPIRDGLGNGAWPGRAGSARAARAWPSPRAAARRCAGRPS